MKLIFIGIRHREVSKLPSEERIRKYPRGKSCEDAKEIARYLAGGEPLAISPGVIRDVIGEGCNEDQPIGTGSIYTDGRWQWCDDLGYYICNYKIDLPREFLIAVRKENYIPPPRGTINVLELLNEYRKQQP